MTKLGLVTPVHGVWERKSRGLPDPHLLGGPVHAQRLSPSVDGSANRG
jgi:hypothetical protein